MRRGGSEDRVERKRRAENQRFAEGVERTVPAWALVDERDFFFPGTEVGKRDGDRATVTVAAGADLPILVRANGVQPREVFLVVDGARGMPAEISMSKRPGQRFRHMFRRVRTEFSFHARGGDDPDGDLTVQVETIHPPLVGTIHSELDFPDYTRLPDEQREGGSIDALIGTRVRIVVTTTAAVERAVLHFLDSDHKIALTPTQIQDDSGLGHAFDGRFVVTETDRYQIGHRFDAA